MSDDSETTTDEAGEGESDQEDDKDSTLTKWPVDKLENILEKRSKKSEALTQERCATFAVLLF